MTARTVTTRGPLRDVERHKRALQAALMFLEDNLPEEYLDPVDKGPVILDFDPRSLRTDVVNLDNALNYLARKFKYS